MSDLDDKVRESIMANVSDAGTFDVEGLDPETVDAVIPLIKQVFADEGWIDPFKVLQIALGEAPVPTEDRYGISEDGKIFGPTKELMTGQAWYDRFDKELEELVKENTWTQFTHPVYSKPPRRQQG